MFSRTLIGASTKNYSRSVAELRDALDEVDAVVVGAGAGLSTSSGLTYSGARFDEHFADFRDRFGISDMYSGGFYPFPDVETFWAWWSRCIMANRYDANVEHGDLRPGKVFFDLLELVRDKDYFVITTNADHQFQPAGFDKRRLFYTQGEYGLWQCSRPCHQKTYDNEEAVRAMVAQQRDMRIPSELAPTCPVCGAPMAMNLRCDDTFVEDEGWHAASNRYHEFLRRHEGMRVLYLELGVGGNTPVIIKYPFWNMTAKNPRATYACINLGEACCPSDIERQSICIDADISRVIADVLALGQPLAKASGE